eukprot:SAG31_NODE_21939_length_537_cov_1.280822_1_plen_129_part_00
MLSRSLQPTNESAPLSPREYEANDFFQRSWGACECPMICASMIGMHVVMRLCSGWRTTIIVFADTMSFEMVLDEWADGTFANVRPTHPQPYGGLLNSILYAVQRGEEKCAEIAYDSSVCGVLSLPLVF